VSESGSREPVRRQAAGRATRCRPQPLVSDQRCKERQRGGCNATGRHYNSGAHPVKHGGYYWHFRFHDFWRFREGSMWRVVRATTPLLVSPSPSASNAFKPARLARPGSKPNRARPSIAALWPIPVVVDAGADVLRPPRAVEFGSIAESAPANRIERTSHR
jgi:hypothetical protein